MTRKTLLRFTLTTLLGAHVLVHGLACSDDDTAEQMGQPQAGAAGSGSFDLSGTQYEGGVNDEAAGNILGSPATVDDAKAPKLSTPADGESLPSSTPPTFIWLASTARRPALPSWLGPERSAHAHGTPFTGVTYILTFSTASNPILLRVATSLTSYTPDAASWALLTSAGGPITAKLTVARLEDSALAVGGGPHTSSAGVTFTVVP